MTRPSQWTLPPDLLVAAIALEIGDELTAPRPNIHYSDRLDRERIKQALRKYFDEGNSYLSFDSCCNFMIDIIYRAIFEAPRE